MDKYFKKFIYFCIFCLTSLFGLLVVNPLAKMLFNFHIKLNNNLAYEMQNGYLGLEYKAMVIFMLFCIMIVSLYKTVE